MKRDKKAQIALLAVAVALIVAGLLVNLSPATPQTTTTTYPCGNPPGTCTTTTTTMVYPYGQWTGFLLIIAGVICATSVSGYQQIQRNREYRQLKAEKERAAPK